MQKAVRESCRLKSCWHWCGWQDISLTSAGGDFSPEQGTMVVGTESMEQPAELGGGHGQEESWAALHTAALSSTAGCVASCHISISKLIQLNGSNVIQIGMWLYFCFCSVLSPSKTCYYISGKVLTLRTSQRHHCNDFQLLQHCLSPELYRIPHFRKAFCATRFKKSTHRNPTPVLAQETRECLRTWGRWDMQQAPAMVNTALPPKSQRSYIEMKSFWEVQSRFAPRVRVKSCLLTEARQILSFPCNKYVLSHVRQKSSAQPKRKDTISDFPISEVKSFCLQKTICENFLGWQSSNHQSIPHQALLSFSGDVSVTLGMKNCYIMSIRF